MKLSVLDQSPISQGSSPSQALENTLKLAQITEKQGYTRFWVAEHHNTNGLASTSPEVLITRLASVTKSMRIGSGGVLLPQYSPFKVAENFKTLEALFPGRIDLGVGRSPGGAKPTQLALTDSIEKSLSEFPRQLTEVQGFMHNTLPRDHPYRMVKAGPRVETSPPLWVLGLSERGAKNAAEIGAGFTYGHFITPANGKAAMKVYREHFKPSPDRNQPEAFVCIFVICAETEEKAEQLALSQDKWLLNVGKGAGTKVASVEDVQKKPFRPDELEKVKENRGRTVIGTPAQVKAELERLAKHYETDEFMIITNIYNFDDKVRSYELLAEAFNLSQRHD